METNSLNPKANGAMDAGKHTARDIGNTADNLGHNASKAADTMGNAASKAGDTMGNAASKAGDTLSTGAKRAGSQLTDAGRNETTNLKADLDDLISKIPHLSEADLTAAKQKLLDTYNSAKISASDLAAQAKDKMSRGVEVGGEYVKEKPLQSVGIAAVVGLLVGALIARR